MKTLLAVLVVACLACVAGVVWCDREGVSGVANSVDGPAIKRAIATHGGD